jgi:LPS-assembly protein
MSSQLKIVTVLLLCHLFRCVPLVISQTRPEMESVQTAAVSQEQARSKIALSAAEGEPVNASFKELEKKGDTYTFRGDVEIVFRDYTLRADTIEYNSTTSEVEASGNVAMDGGIRDIHITATHGTYNARTRTGKFYDVAGTTGARFRGRNVALTSSSPIAFAGRMIEQTGPDVYVVHQGSVTSCELPHPKWTFNAERIVLDVGSSAHIFNSTFRLKGIPIIYLPYVSPPVEQLGRQSGFLIPRVGTSSSRGTFIGDSFYWAVNRSIDAVLGAEYFSKRGWALHEDFRARPSETSSLTLNYFGVIDRGLTPGNDQGGHDVKLNGEALLPGDFRGVASLNYLSSFVFRLAFTPNFSQAVDSEVKSVAFLSKTVQGFSVNVFGSRYQNFQSTTRNDLVTILHAPGFEVSGVDQQIAWSPLYWSFDLAAEGLHRSEPGFTTPNLVGRFDIHPNLSLPIFYNGWTLRSEVALRNTFYTEEQDFIGAGNAPVQNLINRHAIESSVELRPPTLGRIFDRTFLGRSAKHTVETRVVYNNTSGVNNFPGIIRFDFRDILSNTNEVEYGVTNRLYLKHGECNDDTNASGDANAPSAASSAAPSGCTPAGANEFISWDLKQKYFLDPNFGGALVNGRRNVLTTTVDFAGIAFLTDPRRFSPLVSRLRVRSSRNSDLEWQLDYDSQKGRINASTFYSRFRFGDFFTEASHAYLLVPGEIVTNAATGTLLPPCAPNLFHQPPCVPPKFNQVRALLGYGSPSKLGLSAAGSIGFDSTFKFIQYSSTQAAYNWDCCGISLEFRRFALGAVRNENQYLFAFTLANIGTFGRLKSQLRLF